MIFQEFDCPRIGIDADLVDDEIVVAGESFRCAVCGDHHIAGLDVQMQTVVFVDNEIEFRPLPRDAAERAAWLSAAASQTD